MLVFAVIGRNVEALWPRKVMHTRMCRSSCVTVCFLLLAQGEWMLFEERAASFADFVGELGYRQWR